MDLNQLTITLAHDGLLKKEFSSRELTQAYLAAIKRLDPSIHAFITVMEEGALRQADAADAVFASGEATELTGIPLAIKDNILIDGIAATSGSKVLENYVATYDATVISRLKKSGAVFLGKANQDEFAMGSSTENSAYEKTANPWDPSRVPGGSSGGSAAAVAAGMCLGALGSDTGGSIRQPAAFCGVVGVKPTYGRVSRYGLSALASSLDQIGPLAKTVMDAARVLQAISGQDGRDPTTQAVGDMNLSKVTQDIRGIKIGVPKEYFIEGMDPDIKKAIDQAMEKFQELGAEIQEVQLPLTKYALAVYYLTVTSEVSANLARYDGIRYGLSAHDTAKNLAEVYSRSREQGLGAETKRRIILGTYTLSAGYYDQYYVKAQKVRQMIMQEFDRVFRQVDCLLTPTTPSVAFSFGEKFSDPLMMYLSDIYTVPANIGGICGISIPCGFTRGLPIGMQIMGKSFDEETILRVAYAYEQSTDWHTRQPKVR
ncbi:MAG: Asp-tRNA(Asn)/Glu-tRNA(Gln) amidotransferase subunit GatA [Patescibacteria group bacterium]